ncbi:MAG: DoxX family protein [Gemmatimonadetes bacterium]|uniref:DoxX family protein n=1 Tax=Candidatus Kutchimonas denitrificans TaxID=3056748 RepID=A0AAE5CA13_9BACT|nr:DoxX family protein [Gemmatimonadota bacterium]NIR74042.1 DoxX family protein [Candidatus Kutchimonas denitrificans]NIS03031.1 DoxX family protein [Gemmatimonadota bacterium]NIT68748.1 DoxX family protein [Gemmatimonadota bacterium]NIU53329.1 DoxX family membrane protein [Gemmatimonadota bacterium]
MNWLYLIGRILFGLIFIVAGIFGHFFDLSATAQYAEGAGVPLPTLAVIVSGVMITLGGLSLWLGFMMEIGTWLLIIFLVVAAFLVHDFWTVSDPAMMAVQRAAFLKNLSVTGGALILFWVVRAHGYGPFALGRRMGGGAGRAAPSPEPSAPGGEVGTGI